MNKVILQSSDIGNFLDFHSQFEMLSLILSVFPAIIKQEAIKQTPNRNLHEITAWIYFQCMSYKTGTGWQGLTETTVCFFFFRSLTLGCQTCTRVINSCRRTAAVLCTLPRRLWTAGRTEGRRWTAGLWASCCTHWFMEPCLLTDKTTRTWSSRSALETTANPPNHLVRPLWNKRCNRNSSDLFWVLFESHPTFETRHGTGLLCLSKVQT